MPEQSDFEPEDDTIYAQSSMKDIFGDTFAALRPVVLPLGVVLLVLALLSGGIKLLNSASASSHTATSAVTKAGFTNPTVTSKGWLFAGFHGCGQDDWLYYKVTATNPTGQTVNLTVCKGFFKGSTIRY